MDEGALANPSLAVIHTAVMATTYLLAQHIVSSLSRNTKPQQPMRDRSLLLSSHTKKAIVGWRNGQGEDEGGGRNKV